MAELPSLPAPGQSDNDSTFIRAGSTGLKSWGPVRTVEVHRGAPESGLGISIVGGNVDSSGTCENYLEGNSYNTVLLPEVDGVISGIFIKNVITDSPAGRTGQLFTGDHLLEVDETKLTSSDQQFAVQAIKNAGNPVKFKIRSLIEQQVIITFIFLALTKSKIIKRTNHKSCHPYPNTKTSPSGILTVSA